MSKTGARASNPALQTPKHATCKSYSGVDNEVLALVASELLPSVSGSVGDKPGLHRSAFPRWFNLLVPGGAIGLRATRECPVRRIRCNAIASNDWYFPRVLGDIRLRYSHGVRREKSPRPRR